MDALADAAAAAAPTTSLFAAPAAPSAAAPAPAAPSVAAPAPVPTATAPAPAPFPVAPLAAAARAAPAPRTYGGRSRNRKKSRKLEELDEAKQEKKERVEQRKRDDARRAQNKSAAAASKTKTKTQSKNTRRNSAPAGAAKKKDGSNNNNNNNNQRRASIGASAGTAARRVSIDSQTLPQTPPKETNKKRPAESSPPVTSPGDDTAGVSQCKLAGSRKGASASTALHRQFDEEDSSMELELDKVGNKKEKTTEKEEESGGGNGEKMDILDVLSEENPPIVVQLNLHNLSSRKAVKFCSENHLLLNRERHDKNESRPKEFPTDIHFNDVDFSGKIFPTLRDIVVDNSDFEPEEYNGSIFFHGNKGLPDSHEYFDAYDPKIMDLKRGEPLVPIQTRQDWKAAIVNSGHTKHDGDGDVESIGLNLLVTVRVGRKGKRKSQTAAQSQAPAQAESQDDGARLVDDFLENLDKENQQEEEDEKLKDMKFGWDKTLKICIHPHTHTYPPQEGKPEQYCPLHKNANFNTDQFLIVNPQRTREFWLHLAEDEEAANEEDSDEEEPPTPHKQRWSFSEIEACIRSKDSAMTEHQSKKGSVIGKVGFAPVAIGRRRLAMVGVFMSR